MKILVIGGVTGGATAAARIRRQDKNAQIIMLERDRYISFANCGLPYHIEGLVEYATKLLVTDAETFGSYYNIDVRLLNEAVSIEPKAKTVRILNKDSGEEYTESYDRLLLSPGSKVTKPPFEGSDLDGVLSLRSYEDMLEIKQYIDNSKPKSAVVVGAGFIAMEMTEALHANGMDITMIHRGSSIFESIDPDMSEMVEAEMVKHDVKILKEASVNKIEKSDDGKLVVLTDKNDYIKADMVFLAIGSSPESDLAKDSGLELGLRGAIVTNDKMQTSDPDIYAVGDAVQIINMASGKPTTIALAGPAQQQARVAADNMVGKDASYKGALGSSVLKIFDLSVASTGLSSRDAVSHGIDADSEKVVSVSRAGYYPGSEEFTMKVLYEKPSGRIVGAQAVGAEGVDKRCDVIATAIYAGLTAADLDALQLAYAPPYSIPRDAVNIVGGMIDKKLNLG